MVVTRDDDPYTVTAHAMERWVFRFDDQSILTAFARSRPIRKKEDKVIRKHSPRQAKMNRRTNKFVDDGTGAVFVTVNRTLVTVMKLRADIDDRQLSRAARYRVYYGES